MCVRISTARCRSEVIDCRRPLSSSRRSGVSSSVYEAVEKWWDVREVRCAPAVEWLSRSGRSVGRRTCR